MPSTTGSGSVLRLLKEFFDLKTYLGWLLRKVRGLGYKKPGMKVSFSRRSGTEAVHVPISMVVMLFF